MTLETKADELFLKWGDALSTSQIIAIAITDEREECANLVEIYRYGNRPADLIIDLKELAETIRSRDV